MLNESCSQIEMNPKKGIRIVEFNLVAILNRGRLGGSHGRQRVDSGRLSHRAGQKQSKNRLFSTSGAL